MSEVTLFWTLVAMTVGGKPLPTDLVFDNLEACYQAEEQMAFERTRYATEWGARSSDQRELPEFVRQNLVRGVCVPHSPSAQTQAPPAKAEPKPGPGRVYSFSEMTTSTERSVPAPPVQVFIAPLPDYQLPQKPMSFRLTVRNQSDGAIKVRNPLQLLFLSFQRPDGYPIELPRRVPELIADRRGPLPDRPLQGPSPVEFNTAIVNGKQDPEERNDYRIEPGASLEVVFACEKLVGEKILASYLERHVEEGARYIYVSALVSVLAVDTAASKMFRQDEKITLRVPKP